MLEMDPGKSIGDNRTLVCDVAKVALHQDLQMVREVVRLQSGTVLLLD